MDLRTYAPTSYLMTSNVIEMRCLLLSLPHDFFGRSKTRHISKTTLEEVDNIEKHGAASFTVGTLHRVDSPKFWK